MKFETENKILVAGHRGNPSEFPEKWHLFKVQLKLVLI